MLWHEAFFYRVVTQFLLVFLRACSKKKMDDLRMIYK